MRYLIIGLGIYGSNLATDLTDMGHEVIGADHNPTLVEQVKDKISTLTKLVVTKYPKLTECEIKDMVINDKWHTAIVGGAIDTAFSVSIDIEQQVIDLVDRYARRLSDIDASVRNLESRVNSHLAKMGF